MLIPYKLPESIEYLYKLLLEKRKGSYFVSAMFLSGVCQFPLILLLESCIGSNLFPMSHMIHSIFLLLFSMLENPLRTWFKRTILCGLRYQANLYQLVLDNLVFSDLPLLLVFYHSCLVLLQLPSSLHVVGGHVPLP